MEFRKLDRHMHVTVMGLGLFGGGAGAARFWSRLGSHVTVTDLRDAETLKPSLDALADCDCRFVLGRHETADFSHADVVVVNPAVKPKNKYVAIARQAGADITTEIGMIFRIARGPILAVTGSNGKSTTTAMLGAMLREHDSRTLVGGNIGGSLLEAMPTHNPAAPLVLEFSSFQLHYLQHQKIAPTVAVVTNLSPNHLDWHRTVLHYYESKRNITRFQHADDWAALNVEDVSLREWVADCPARVVQVARHDTGARHACFLRPSETGATITVRLHGEETALAPLAALKLPGAHNVTNALLAAAAAYIQARDPEAIRRGLENFAGLPHRLENVCTVGGVRFVNDSIATTPEATVAGLQSFDAPVVLIAGGYDKGTSFDELGAMIGRHAQGLVLIGATAGNIRAAVEKSGGDCAIHEAGEDFARAVRLAFDACPRGGVVLLSPACASYDMFTNFEARGARFRELARELDAT